VKRGERGGESGAVAGHILVPPAAAAVHQSHELGIALESGEARVAEDGAIAIVPERVLHAGEGLMVGIVLNAYAPILRHLGKKADAKSAERRAAAITELVRAGNPGRFTVDVRSLQN
jgi:hypothetical protein